MKKTALFVSIFLIFCTFLGTTVKASPIGKTGTLNVKINGVQYSMDLFIESNPYAYEVTAGNKNFEIRLSWMYISSPKDIFSGTTELSENNATIKVGYIDFTTAMNYYTHGGKLTVTGNDGNRISGEFNFTAIGKENAWTNTKKNNTSGSNAECRISDGTFEIIYGS